MVKVGKCEKSCSDLDLGQNVPNVEIIQDPMILMILGHLILKL